MTVEVEELDENELFNQTVGDGDEAETPNEQTAAPEETDEQATGDDAPAETETEAEQPRPEVDDNAPLIPSWRLREIREERQKATEENATLKARLAELERIAQQQQPTRQPQEEAKPNRPDPLMDPEGYAKAVREEIRQELLADRREESLQRARETNQQEFDEAYSAARRAVDPALKARMQNSRDPGRTLLEWHRENKVKAEVGSDPNAWLEKKMEERLKDPAFLAKAVELARGAAQQPQSTGRKPIELPPSISSMSRSGAANRRAGNDDVSDEQLFIQTTG